MTAIIVSSGQPFGSMSNETVVSFKQLDDYITRMGAAIASAASGYSGTEGQEFEGTGTNFGVVATDNEGTAGKNFRSAWDNLSTQWATAKTAMQPYVNALDNGG